jgi:UDP-N-acetyl-D-mannosaminuronate dehydrogenase
MPEYSISPTGEKFQLPEPEDYVKEFERLQEVVYGQRALGREIVLVMGLGFVGAVMAALIAGAKGGKGNPTKFVIGMQRPSLGSYWNPPFLNRGISAVSSEDPEVALMINRCVNEKKTLIATYTHDALELADVVIVDVQCDYLKKPIGDVRDGRADMEALEESLEITGQDISLETLVLIETTVVSGTTEQVAYPIIKKMFRKRGMERDPLLAHSF